MTDSFVPVEDSTGSTRKIANVRFTDANGDVVEMQRTGDYMNGADYLTDQAGAGGVLTFTFGTAVQLVYVRSVGGVARVTTGSATPSATTGAYVGADESFPFPSNVTQVKVFASAGTTVSVWGYRF